MTSQTKLRKGREFYVYSWYVFHYFRFLVIQLPLVDMEIWEKRYSLTVTI